MKQRIKHAFDNIKAEESLKQNTLSNIYKQAGSKAQTTRRKRRSRRLRYAAIMSALVILVLFGAGSYNTAYAYVDIEVESAIELTLNRYGRVISTRAYNAEGQALLDSMSLRDMTYEDALADLLHAMEQQGYAVDGKLVSVALQASDAQAESNLSQNVNHCLNQMLDHHENAEVEVNTVTEEVKKQAGELNISAAKYLAILELQQANPAVEAGHCADYSIDELKEQTRQHHQQRTESDDVIINDADDGVNDEHHDEGNAPATDDIDEGAGGSDANTNINNGDDNGGNEHNGHGHGNH